jgi:threonine synthase
VATSASSVVGVTLAYLECPRCGARRDADAPADVCDCGSPLLARYDLAAVRAAVTPDEIARRPADLWRYRELLPVRDPAHAVTLGEGWTPLLPAVRFGRRIGLPGLLIKDEGALPTGSFKARGAAVGVSRAAELGIGHIALPTNGNAGAAWATYAARAGMRATVAMPVAAPVSTRRECLAAGADLHLVDGLIDDAGAMIATFAAASGAFNASTLREPYRIEGKKTLALEILEQLGWRAPDVIVYPTGGGVGLIGIHKAVRELRELGWLSGGGPRLVVVQSTGCAPIVRAFAAGQRRAEPWANPSTAAFGINVASPLGDELILEAVYATDGTAVAVDDAEILADLRQFGRDEGLWLCPEGAACLTGVRRLLDSGWLDRRARVVVVNTGAGVKYPETVPADDLPVLAPGDPLPA